MGIAKAIVIVLASVLALLAGIGMVLPRHSHVERSIDIAAPRATVFVLVDGFKQFNKWSPWAAQDPNARYTIEGPEFGVGAKQSWVGDPKTVGRGSQEIVDVKPMESVTSRLDFGEEGTATATMLLAPAADGTRVTWSLETDNGAGPIGRWFGLMMDRWIGPDYENGLANLKKLAESLPKADFADLAVTIVEVKPATMAYLPSQSSRETAAMGEALGAAFTKIVAFMKAEGLGQAGPPTAINTRWDDAGYGFDAAIPVDKPPSRELPPEAAVKVRRSYGGKALRIVSKGPYGGMPPDYDKLLAFMAARGYESAGPSWDEYISDPGKTPELELITNFYQPVK